MKTLVLLGRAMEETKAAKINGPEGDGASCFVGQTEYFLTTTGQTRPCNP